MVCRENTVSSAIMTQVRIRTGLTDQQIIGLMHEINRDSAARTTPAPGVQEYRDFLENQMERLGTLNASPARRAAIARRLQSAINDDSVPSGRIWRSQRQLQMRATMVADGQNQLISDIARQSGRARVEVEAIYRRHLRSGLPHGVSRTAAPEIDEFLAPQDRHTRWAVHATRAELGLEPIAVPNCESCGQFRGNEHVCPGSDSHPNGHTARVTPRQQRTRRPRASRTIHPDATDVTTSTTPETAVSRCQTCGQFMGAGEHTCNIIPRVIPTRRTSSHGILRSIPQRTNLYDRINEGSIASFYISYSEDGIISSRDFRAGASADGQAIEVWPVSENTSQNAVDTLTSYLNSGWRLGRIRPPESERNAYALEQRIHAASSGLVFIKDNPANMSFVDDMTVFQEAYNKARYAKMDNADELVSFMTENATGGLGNRQTGRGYGVEIEFEVEDMNARRGIAQILHENDILKNDLQYSYHSSADYMNGEDIARYWRFERDRTVSGEIISPILYDHPEDWEKLRFICETIKAHGGRTSMSVGGHVHVGMPDYGRQAELYANFLRTMKENEDVIYRIAQNPRAPQHRGTGWCSPSWNVRSYETVSGYQSAFRSHCLGINLAAADGTRNGHVEFRMWDGSLDPGVIQAQVKASLGIVNRASHTVASGEYEEYGTHAAKAEEQMRRGARPTQEEWEQETLSFRKFLDDTMPRTEDKKQLTELFATTEWQMKQPVLW